MISENYEDYEALAYAFAGLGIFVTISIEQIAMSLASSSKKNIPKTVIDVETGNNHSNGDDCNHSHSHNTLSIDHDHSSISLNDVMKAKSIKEVIVAYALEISTAVHSIIIGINLGLMSEDNYNTIAIMVAVLSFHQFVEGFGLGSILRTSRDSLGSSKILVFILIFTFIVSIGIIIGIGISYGEEENKDQLLVKGSVTSIAAGCLLYTALAEILPSCFEGHHCQDKLSIKLQILAAFGIGFASMCIIGIWA